MAPRASRKQDRTSRKPWDGNISDLKKIGQGATAFVFIVDKRSVVKVPNGLPVSDEAFERERDVYLYMQRSTRDRQPYVISCLDWSNPRGLVLERCVETLRSRLSRIHGHRDAFASTSGNYELMEQAEQWAFQAASGLEFIHQNDIIQADVGCHNMLLDKHNTVKIADFSGSVIQSAYGMEQSALVSYGVRSQLPNAKAPSTQTDIFALGSAIYEMATGHLPLHDVPDKLVRQRFKRQQWPDMRQIRRTNPRLFGAITGCWELRFSSAQKVADYIASPSSQNRLSSNLFVHGPPTSGDYSAMPYQNQPVDGWASTKQVPEHTSKNQQNFPRKRLHRTVREKNQKDPNIVDRWISYFGGQ